MQVLFLKSCTEPMVFQLANVSDTGVEVVDQITDTEITHGRTSTMLLYGIELLLSRNGILLENIGAIYMSTGPGSYTGARILVSIVKTLHQIHPTIPIYDVSLLDLYYKMSEQVQVSGTNNRLGVAFARRNKYYVSGVIDGQNILQNVVDTETLMTYLAADDVIINGLPYTDNYELKYYVELPMDIAVWHAESHLLEDVNNFEPLYLEEVNIG